MLNFFTPVSPVTDANVRWRTGYFDDNDGIFLQGQGTTISWVLRSSTSGVPVDTVVAQSAWNRDGFDTSVNSLNPSNITMDFDNKNLLAWIDLQWLSLGRVRCGFDLGGSLLTSHEFNHSNLTAVAYMKNPNLVMRYEIEATGTPGAIRTFEPICLAAVSEGGFNPTGLSTSISNNRTGVAVTSTYGEVISVRVKSANIDTVQMMLKEMDIIAPSKGDIHWVLVLNPTGISAGTWVSAGSESSLEYNVTRGTGWSRGSEEHILAEGYFTEKVSGATPHINSRFHPGAQVDGTADILSLQCANADAAGSETIFAALQLSEIF